MTPFTTAQYTSSDVDRLRARVRELLPGVRADLERLVRIQSVSAPAFDQAHVQASADLVEELLRGAGLQAGQRRVPDGAPAVVGRRPGPQGSPTVLLYAHHDVQPPGSDADWTAAPFEPAERDGRLFGRGAADDKAGVMAHVGALRALGDDLGVGVKVFVEGEEEIGSPTFARFLATYQEELRSDVIVVADSSNWRVGVPALTTSLRGLVDGTITVRTLDHAVHSGMYGGPVPDAMLAMIRLLDTLWDAAGDVAMPGLVSREAEPLDYPEADFRSDVGLLDGVHLIGTGGLTSRMWTKPAVTITGIDAPTVAEASNTLLPVVRAKFTMRIAPGQDSDAAMKAVAGHLAANAPFGASVEVSEGEAGSAFAADVEGPVYGVARAALEAAWGRAPVQIGIGGSIPFIADLLEVYPEATVLVTGVEDPDSRAHGADESLHLGEFERAILAEALFLTGLSRVPTR
jgi:acetylornithine deacetylase/succinyl-diaminopimelate desuccinylase-like protein